MLCHAQVYVSHMHLSFNRTEILYLSNFATIFMQYYLKTTRTLMVIVAVTVHKNLWSHEY